MSFSDISSSSVKNGGGRPVAKPQNEVDAAVGRLGDSLQRLQVDIEDAIQRLSNLHKVPDHISSFNNIRKTVRL